MGCVIKVHISIEMLCFASWGLARSSSCKQPQAFYTLATYTLEILFASFKTVLTRIISIVRVPSLCFYKDTHNNFDDELKCSSLSVKLDSVRFEKTLQFHWWTFLLLFSSKSEEKNTNWEVAFKLMKAFKAKQNKWQLYSPYSYSHSYSKAARNYTPLVLYNSADPVKIFTYIMLALRSGITIVYEVQLRRGDC